MAIGRFCSPACPYRLGGGMRECMQVWLFDVNKLFNNGLALYRERREYSHKEYHGNCLTLQT